MNIMDLIAGGGLDAIRGLMSGQSMMPEDPTGSVPMPTPRPPGAMLPDPNSIASFAPTDTQRPPMGRPPMSLESGGLRDLIAPSLGRSVAASLGGGLSTVGGNTGGGAFARGMGGSLKAGTKFDGDEFGRSVQALDRVQKAQESGANHEYKTALSDYYRTLIDRRKDASAKAAQPVSARTNKPAPTVPEISMKGDGTQGAPYAPNSKADYDEIVSGSYYVHPASGQIRIKK